MKNSLVSLPEFSLVFHVYIKYAVVLHVSFLVLTFKLTLPEITQYDLLNMAVLSKGVKRFWIRPCSKDCLIAC